MRAVELSPKKGCLMWSDGPGGGFNSSPDRSVLLFVG